MFFMLWWLLVVKLWLQIIFVNALCTILLFSFNAISIAQFLENLKLRFLFYSLISWRSDLSLSSDELHDLISSAFCHIFSQDLFTNSLPRCALIDFFIRRICKREKDLVETFWGKLMQLSKIRKKHFARLAGCSRFGSNCGSVCYVIYHFVFLSFNAFEARDFYYFIKLTVINFSSLNISGFCLFCLKTGPYEWIKLSVAFSDF